MKKIILLYFIISHTICPIFIMGEDNIEPATDLSHLLMEK